MVRCEMKEGEHITIAYGSDEVIGYILSVYDDRLETPGTDTSDEVYEICEAVEPCGTGCYHGLVTGIGIGKKVSKATMEYFWKLYGVPESQIHRGCVAEKRSSRCEGSKEKGKASWSLNTRKGLRLLGMEARQEA